jgi:hypothetical protein
LPFALLLALAEWQREIPKRSVPCRHRFRYLSAPRAAPPQSTGKNAADATGALVIRDRHGLMLVPIYLGLCATSAHGHELAGPLVEASLGMAILVSVVHVAAMIAAGGYLAWLVYRYLGLKFASRSWFNLETTGLSVSSWLARSRSRLTSPGDARAAGRDFLQTAWPSRLFACVRSRVSKPSSNWA